MSLSSDFFDVRCSDVETRILSCLGNGLATKEIAVLLGRQPPTIEGHIRILFAKFNARSRAHLVAIAMRSGFLDKAS